MNEQQPIVKEAPQDIDACLTILGFDSVPQAAKQLAATTLEQSYQLMYANRRLRPIEGPDGIIERTIGQFANGEWQPTFQDTLRGATVESELAEFGTELQKYQNSGDLYDAVQALLELCDIQFQEEVIRQRIATLTNLPPAAQHENLKQIEFALQLFALATQQIILPQLAAAQLQTAPIAKLARIKYAVRARLSEKGYKGKHKRLENTLCLHVLQIWKEAGGNDNPDLVVRELGYDSIEDYFDVLSTSINHGKATLFDIAQAKYGNPLAPEQLRANFRPIRPLTGPSSQAARLFGLEGTQYAPSAVYRDNGQPKQTDVAQFEAALQNYDHDPSHAQTIELILNTAAFYWQLAILNALHTPSSERMLLEALLVNQIQSIEKELAARGIDSRLLEQSAKLVFSSRLLVEKNKPLERKLIGKLLTSEN